VQLFRYALVGAAGALADAGVLAVLTTIYSWPVLVAAAASFLLATVLTYLLSVRWVFRSTGRVSMEFLLFALVGVGGMALNELILWVAIDAVGMVLLAGKLISLAIGVFWSFGMRRLLFTRLAGRSVSATARRGSGRPRVLTM
jgi:putative flippase GtrA